MNFLIRTDNGFIFSLLARTPSTCGIPLPQIMGSFIISFPTNRATRMRRMNQLMVYQMECCDEKRNCLTCSDFSKISRYKTTTRPETNPTIIPSRASLSLSCRSCVNKVEIEFICFPPI